MEKTTLVFRVLTMAALVAALCGAPEAAHAVGSRCYVDQDASGGTYNGATWETAYRQLYQALADVGCAEIWVAEGVYTPNPSSRSNRFDIAPGEAIYGGWAGGEGSLEERNLPANLTILSGDIDGDDANHLTTNINETAADIHGSNSYHVVWVGYSSTSTTVLDGFTITGGDSDDAGGGLYCDGRHSFHSCSPTLANLVFSGNRASSEGGAIYNDGRGGGASSPSLTDVLFTGNTATYGGAMYNAGEGGISSPTLNRATFSGNTATYGGAMYNDGTAGSMILPGASSPKLSNVTFSENSAEVAGGAVYNDGYDDEGHSNPELRNVTFHGNSTTGIDGFGGGMLNVGALGGQCQPVLVNVIMWGDTAHQGSEISNNSATPNISYSDIQGSGGSGAWAGPGTNGGNNIDADPLFNSLSYSGGYTPTITLRWGSPANDAGSNMTCGMPPVEGSDQRGVARPQDGDGDGTATCDMGATESRIGAKTIRSLGADDGWVLESSETSSFGGTMNASATTLNLGDDAADRQFRAILSFGTASLPDSAELISLKLKIKRADQVGTNPFSTLGNIRIDMRRGAFGGSAALQTADFQAAAHKTNAASMPNNLSSGWYTKNLPSSSFGYINLKGKTQLRLYFATGDDDDHAAEHLILWSGNAASANRPKLIIDYYVP